MKCLVTGAAGFIGQNLVKRLLREEDVEIVALDNFSLGKEETLRGLPVKVVKINVKEAHLYLCNEGFDYIFHFAAPSSVIQYNKHPVGCILDTVLGFNSILTVAEECGAKLIYPSSGNVYGDSKSPQHEFIKPKPNNLYAAGKLITEELAKHTSVESVGLRIFAGYGPGEEHKGGIASVVTLFLNDILKEKPVTVYGDGTQSRDFIFIDDIIDGIMATAFRRTPQIVNLGSGESHTFNELVTLIGSVYHLDTQIKYVDKPLLYVDCTCADTSVMSQALGIMPRGLEQGLRDYLGSRGKH